MFKVCKDYLVYVLKNIVHEPAVHVTKGDHQGNREAAVFSMPTRGKLEMVYDYQARRVYRWKDPYDTQIVKAQATTDATGNTGLVIKDANAHFHTSGIAVGDFFRNRTSKTWALVTSIVSETQITISDTAAGGNSMAYQIKDKTAAPLKKYRILCASCELSFIVELYHKNTQGLVDDLHSFICALPKFIYDGKCADYINEKGDPVSDRKGNKIKLSLSELAFNDNKFYGDHPDMVKLLVTFSGGIYVDPDPLSGELEYPIDAPAIETALKKNDEEE